VSRPGSVPHGRESEYACAVNVVDAALIGGFVGALVVSVLGVLVAWRERGHDLRVRTLEHEHRLRRATLEDAARLRDARVARLTAEAKELARALFDLERLALLMQWGESADKEEMRRLELSARTRFESARAGLTLDPDGARLTAMFESLTIEIARYQSMVQSHRVFVEARAVQQAIDHAAEMEVQRGRVVEGVTAALDDARLLLASIAVPVESPPAVAPAGEVPQRPAAAVRPIDEPTSGLPVPDAG
jgi:hypothetical protein